eukprot:11166268-Prorocentrum_lima.AAC.1
MEWKGKGGISQPQCGIAVIYPKREALPQKRGSVGIGKEHKGVSSVVPPPCGLEDTSSARACLANVPQ